MQTFALPLGYGTGFGAVDETRTRDIHLGKVALYQLSYYRMLHHAKKVRTKRLELLRLRHRNLNPARLPFRHARKGWKIGQNSDPLEIRTPDTLIKSQVLCQLS